MEIDQIKLAEEIAREAHKDQKYGDQPFIIHPESVVNKVISHFHSRLDDNISAAWLHDVVEDTETTFKDLIYEGVEIPVIYLIDLLTHRKDESYLKYILRIKENKDATMIKLCDLESNLENCYQNSVKYKSRIAKYELAKYILKGSEDLRFGGKI